MFGYYKVALSIDGKKSEAWQKVALNEDGAPVAQVGIVDASGKDIDLPEVYEIRITDPELYADIK